MAANHLFILLYVDIFWKTYLPISIKGLSVFKSITIEINSFMMAFFFIFSVLLETDLKAKSCNSKTELKVYHMYLKLLGNWKNFNGITNGSPFHLKRLCLRLGLPQYWLLGYTLLKNHTIKVVSLGVGVSIFASVWAVRSVNPDAHRQFKLTH